MGHAARLLCGNAEETLHSRICPTTEQRDFLREQWNGLAEHLKAALNSDYGLPVSTWIQGSYKYGTLLRPVSKHDEFDVDLGVYFEWSSTETSNPSPRQLREWVQRELHAYAAVTPEVRAVEEPPKERCSRTRYASQFHIDTPVYHLDRATDYRRLATWEGAWEDKDPKPLYTWFKEAVPEDRRDQLRRIIRYLKAWTAITFVDADGARPSSTMLSVLAAEAFAECLVEGSVATADDDVLAEIIAKVWERLSSNQCVTNPADEREDLNRVDSDSWGECLRRFEELSSVAERAIKAEDEAAAAFIWAEAFSYLMPLADSAEQEIVESSQRSAIVTLPNVLVQVYDSSGRYLHSHENAVPLVAKGRTLRFSISNPQIVPDYATVEWTVRNSDTEAATIGDLGHRRSGIRMLTVDETTQYSGQHYMDCVVRVNGQIFALRRVPVVVSASALPARNAPRPQYTRIRGSFRRR